jgi:hypothetical protein
LRSVVDRRPAAGDARSQWLCRRPHSRRFADPRPRPVVHAYATCWGNAFRRAWPAREPALRLRLRARAAEAGKKPPVCNLGRRRGF